MTQGWISEINPREPTRSPHLPELLQKGWG